MRRPARIPVKDAVSALVEAGVEPERIEIDLVNHTVYARAKPKLERRRAGGTKTDWSEAIPQKG